MLSSLTAIVCLIIAAITTLIASMLEEGNTFANSLLSLRTILFYLPYQFTPNQNNTLLAIPSLSVAGPINNFSFAWCSCLFPHQGKRFREIGNQIKIQSESLSNSLLTKTIDNLIFTMLDCSSMKLMCTKTFAPFQNAEKNAFIFTVRTKVRLGGCCLHI